MTRPSAQIDGGRGGDREQDAEVADVAVDQQQQRRDEADQDDAEPGSLGKSHVGIVTSVPDSTLTPELALRYLDELSTDIRAAVLIGGDGRVAAAHAADGDPPADKLGDLAARLLARADEAAGDLHSFQGPVTQVEATTATGAVFAVRAEDWTIAVVAGRFALPSLMFYDLRAVLSDLGKKAA
jgi:predicted regulator of Ras-like GTPase activity (Roadblock/LC7/MglB family)